MSILYLDIINLETPEIVGTYETIEQKDSALKTDIENKSKELMSQIKTENKNIKNHINFKTDSNGTIEIYYLSTNKGILYLTFLEISSENSKTFKEQYIYELLENIDSQNIFKFVGDDDKLSNVGKQNLKMAIDNYHNTYKFGTGEGLIEEDPVENQSQKITNINNQINDVKNDMKENVKNMMTNMSDINDIEGKSVSIKDTSFQFQKDSKSMENKMKRQALRNKILTYVVGGGLLACILYFFFK